MSSYRHRRATHHRIGGRLPLACGDDLRKRSARVPTTRCINGGKRRYFTRGDAELALSGVDHDDPRRRDQRCYQCPACHGWHLTSLSLAEYAEVSRPVPTGSFSFDHITTGPAPSPAEVAARARRRVQISPVPQENPAPPLGFGTRLRRRLRRRLAHSILPAVLRRVSKGHRP